MSLSTYRTYSRINVGVWMKTIGTNGEQRMETISDLADSIEL